jgi:hypothetical protein
MLPSNTSISLMFFWALFFFYLMWIFIGIETIFLCEIMHRNVFIFHQNISSFVYKAIKLVRLYQLYIIYRGNLVFLLWCERYERKSALSFWHHNNNTLVTTRPVPFFHLLRVVGSPEVYLLKNNFPCYEAHRL